MFRFCSFWWLDCLFWEWKFPRQSNPRLQGPDIWLPPISKSPSDNHLTGLDIQLILFLTVSTFLPFRCIFYRFISNYKLKLRRPDILPPKQICQHFPFLSRPPAVSRYYNISNTSTPSVSEFLPLLCLLHLVASLHRSLWTTGFQSMGVTWK